MVTNHPLVFQHKVLFTSVLGFRIRSEIPTLRTYSKCFFFAEDLIFVGYNNFHSVYFSTNNFNKQHFCVSYWNVFFCNPYFFSFGFFPSVFPFGSIRLMFGSFGIKMDEHNEETITFPKVVLLWAWYFCGGVVLLGVEPEAGQQDLHQVQPLFSLLHVRHGPHPRSTKCG
jgi:hypothetical protein